MDQIPVDSQKKVPSSYNKDPGPVVYGLRLPCLLAGLAWLECDLQRRDLMATQTGAEG
jgi:hypothetical protein